MLDCEQPVIAKINDRATGLGATIALFCDVIFASEAAEVGDPHVAVGFVAADGGAIIWPPHRHQGFQAPACGLDHFHPVLNRGVLAEGATKAIRWSKMCVNVGLKQPANSIMGASLAYEAVSNITPDHQEAVNVFREKRAPKFSAR